MSDYYKEFGYAMEMNFICDDKTLLKKYKEEWGKLET